MNTEQKSVPRRWLLVLLVVNVIAATIVGFGIARAAGLGDDSDPGPKLVCVSSAGPVTIEPGEGAPTVTGDSRIDCWEGKDLP